MRMVLLFMASPVFALPESPHTPLKADSHDPCWHSAKAMLSASGLQAVEEEAQEWRRTLGANLERYHNSEQAAYYSRYPRSKPSVEARWRTDFHPRPPNTGNNLHDIDVMSANSQEAYTRRRFDFFLPRRVAERTPQLCKRPLLLGDEHNFRGSVDGFVACGVDEMVAAGQLRRAGSGSAGGGVGGGSGGGGGGGAGGGACIVYSLGSNNKFDFEAAVLRKTNCTVHTFDCTSSPPLQSMGPRFTFHKTCVGQSRKGMEHPEAFKTLPAIMSELGHEGLSIIKWDVEGFEYDIFRDVLSDASGLHSKLPREILFELHYRSHMGARTAWWDREKTAGEVSPRVRVKYATREAAVLEGGR